MKKLKKYSIELLASLIGEKILFEGTDYESWENVEIEFTKCTAVISGIMHSRENLSQEVEFYKADLSNVVLQFEDSETVFTAEEIIELETLIKLYK